MADDEVRASYRFSRLSPISTVREVIQCKRGRQNIKLDIVVIDSVSIFDSDMRYPPALGEHI